MDRKIEEIKIEPFAIFADHFEESMEGKFTIAGIFDGLHIGKGNKGVLSGYFITKFKGPPNQSYEFKLRVENDRGYEVPIPKNKSVYSNLGSNGKMTVIIQIEGIKIEKGTYLFKIICDDKVLVKKELKVT